MSATAVAVEMCIRDRSKDVCAALRSAYGHALKIYRAEIPVSTRTAESAASTHSVLTYDANGPASLAYKALAKEVTENERRCV